MFAVAAASCSRSDGHAGAAAPDRRRRENAHDVFNGGGESRLRNCPRADGDCHGRRESSGRRCSRLVRAASPSVIPIYRGGKAGNFEKPTGMRVGSEMQSLYIRKQDYQTYVRWARSMPWRPPQGFQIVTFSRMILPGDGA